ncbi:MAG TPA: winged helix-turn-helix domain-containing protein [Candidatus Limnocylindrales bacterium]|nr:winged helix-turn-helix domain-containing protein [Candidatus Limnocylindrales bacterium]
MRLTTPGRGVTYCFGRFVLDPAKRTLTRDGDAVPLGAKAFDLLHYLVREDGRVVSKTEILDNVWPGTFVEEGNIFQTISVLRKALDPFFDGESPIATVARQGYRFAAAVERREVKSVLTQVDDGVVAVPSAADQPVQPEPAQSAAVPLSAPAAPRRWWWGAGIAALLLAAVGIGVSMRPGPPKPVAPVAPRRSVAVLPFQNLSGKPDAAWFSTALAETLGSQLAAGDRLRAIGGDQVARSVRELSLPAGTGLGPSQISDVRSNLGCDLVLTGSYLLWNGKLRVDLQAFDAQTGETAGMLTDTNDARNLIPLVEKLGSQMSAKLGAGTPAERRRIASAISSNPQAAMLYFRGLTANRVADVPAAKAYFQEALKADPKFALAHSALASALLGGGYEQQAADEAKKDWIPPKGLPAKRGCKSKRITPWLPIRMTAPSRRGVNCGGATPIISTTSCRWGRRSLRPRKAMKCSPQWRKRANCLRRPATIRESTVWKRLERNSQDVMTRRMQPSSAPLLRPREPRCTWNWRVRPSIAASYGNGGMTIRAR